MNLHYQYLECLNKEKSTDLKMPMLILHGFLGSASNWRTFAKSLQPFYDIFLLDLRNHGHSPHAEKMSYPMMAEDVLSFCKEKEIQKFNIAGHSMGGKVAIQLAVDSPERVNKMCVLDISFKSYEARHDNILESLQRLNLEKYSSRQDIEIDLAEKINDLTLARFLLKNLNIVDQKYIWRIPLSFLAKNKIFLQQGIEIKKKIDISALFLRGDKSNYISSEDKVGIKEKFSNVVLADISNSGHWLQVDQPEILLQKMKDFF